MSENKSKITLQEITEAVDRGELNEKDLAQYFTLESDHSYNLAPDFRLDPDKVDLDMTEDRGLGQIALNTANYLCKKARKREYSKRTWDAYNNGKELIRVIAEGDSWLQYPFKLDDVIDHLNKRNDLAVYCFSDAGDVLSNMIHKKEFMSGLIDQRPHYFILSGGGNDLVDGAGIERFVLPYQEGRTAKDYLRPEYQNFRSAIYSGYRSICSEILKYSPSTKILCHGYSLPIPHAKGKWLGKPLVGMGITDPALQRDIVKVIMNDVNGIIQKAVSAFTESAKYLDVRGTVADDGWYDEFHPTSEEFANVAAVFSREIK